MKVGICHREGSFSDRWLEYLIENKIPFVILDPFNNSFVESVVNEKLTHFMWHFDQNFYKDILNGKNIFKLLSILGIKTFPNESSYWHFDDKIAQKYLLESINAPFVQTDVFFEKKVAIDYINNSSFPKVFKLRGGAGAINVKLVKDRKHAIRAVNKAFGKGFKSYNSWTLFYDTIERFKRIRSLRNFLRIIKGGINLVITPKQFKIYPNQRGYVYFQEFLPDQKFDIRLIVIGEKAFYLKRYTRDNDFRASGSGRLEFKPQKDFSKSLLDIAFDLSRKLDMQCVAYDFVYDSENLPKVIEISYGFQPYVYDQCKGYFNNELNWVEADVNLEREIIKNFLKK